MILTHPAEHGLSADDASSSPAAATRRPAHLLRPLLLIFLAAMVAVTSGCASYLGAQVTSFHQADSKRLAGRSFVITPTKEQAESLEFRTYANLLRDSLVGQGLVASTPADAELEVTMRYTVDGGKAVTYGYPVYGYSYAAYDPYWGWGPYYGPYYMWAPYPVAYGYGQSILYRRELRVEITERGPARDASGGGRLFEGTVVSEGESSSIAPVMPAMMRALFSDFPGPSGVSRRVQVRLDDAPAATR